MITIASNWLTWSISSHCFYCCTMTGALPPVRTSVPPCKAMEPQLWVISKVCPTVMGFMTCHSHVPLINTVYWAQGISQTDCLCMCARMKLKTLASQFMWRDWISRSCVSRHSTGITHGMGSHLTGKVLEMFADGDSTSWFPSGTAAAKPAVQNT